jgi:hypothetical protein
MEHFDNVIHFPHPYRGDPDPRRAALASIGFRWTGSTWRRGRVVLTDLEIDAMDEPTWAPCLQCWTRRQPPRRDSHRGIGKKREKRWMRARSHEFLYTYWE